MLSQRNEEYVAQRLQLIPREDRLETIQLARDKAWNLATNVNDFSDEERELLAKARIELPPKAIRRLSDKLFLKYHQQSLMRFLFGGYVDLVGHRVDPLRAWDPDDNPWLQWYVPGFAITMDEHDQADPFKPLPDTEYLRYLTYAWLHRPLLAVPKSRQLMMTWLFMAIGAHMSLFLNAKRIAVISKKEEDADALLERMRIVVDNLPKEYNVPDWKKKYTYVSVGERSNFIHALNEEAKGARSYTFSWIFSDEVAFQEQADEFIRASLPAVHDGARMTLVSTPNGEETFWRFVTQSGKIEVPAGA